MLFSNSSVFFIVLLIVMIALLLSSIVIVPQGFKYVVQRLGRYHINYLPGLNFRIPVIDQIAFRVTTKDIVLDIPSQDVITKDNVVIAVNAVAYINIATPERAVYGVENYGTAILNLIQTTLRSIIGCLELDEALSSRDHIKAKLIAGVVNEIKDWGIILKNVEIQDIQPSGTMQAAMEEQAAAERERRAMITRAEGKKSANILEAEGNLQAAKQDGQARICLAEASANSIHLVAKAAAEANSDTSLMFLLGEKYIESIKETAQSSNAKIVVLPSDIMKAVEGFIKR